jgi:hypothetical protein
MVNAKVRKDFHVTMKGIVNTITDIAKTTLNDECTAALNEFNESNAHTRKSKRKRDDDSNHNSDNRSIN